jgi:hypothetical protein
VGDVAGQDLHIRYVMGIREDSKIGRKEEVKENLAVGGLGMLLDLRLIAVSSFPRVVRLQLLLH